jgi:hypothetical protein
MMIKGAEISVIKTPTLRKLPERIVLAKALSDWFGQTSEVVGTVWMRDLMLGGWAASKSLRRTDRDPRDTKI